MLAPVTKAGGKVEGEDGGDRIEEDMGDRRKRVIRKNEGFLHILR